MGCYDVHERVKDMSAGGVLASLCFPSMVAFAGRIFAQMDDKDAALAFCVPTTTGTSTIGVGPTRAGSSHFR